MAKTFSIPFTCSTVSLLEHAKDAALQSGSQLIGDTQRGNFHGKGVKGSYEVTGNTVKVTIDEKPLPIPWAAIEFQLRKFFQ